MMPRESRICLILVKQNIFVDVFDWTPQNFSSVIIGL